MPTAGLPCPGNVNAMLMGRRPSLCFCIPNSRSGGRCQGAAAERDKARTGPARRGDALAWRRIPLKFTIDFQDRIYFTKFKRLGRTDISVSEICLGTMTWGSQNSQADAHGKMDRSEENTLNSSPYCTSRMPSSA